MDNKYDTTVDGNLTAIYKDDDTLLFARFRKEQADYKLCQTISLPFTEDEYWASAEHLGILPGKRSVDQQLVVGFDAMNIVFDHLELPDVATDLFRNMLCLQAETLIPLDSDSTCIAYRVSPVRNNRRPVTFAVGRKSMLDSFYSNLKPLKPNAIIMDSQAIIGAWRYAFSPVCSGGIIIDLANHKTTLCMVENNELINCITLETNINQLDQSDFQISMQLLVQDVKSAVKHFGFDKFPDVKLFVISDGSEQHRNAYNALRASGFNVELSLPRPDVFTSVLPDNIYHYRVPIGLILLHDKQADKPLDLFTQFAEPERFESSADPERKLKIKAMMLSFILVLFFLGYLYYADIARLNAAEAELVNIRASQLNSQRQINDSVAQYRMNPLALIQMIKDSGNNSLRFESMEFVRDRTTLLTGTAQQIEQVYAFQNKLLSNDEISSVEIENAVKQDRVVNFSISFKYTW